MLFVVHMYASMSSVSCAVEYVWMAVCLSACCMHAVCCVLVCSSVVLIRLPRFIIYLFYVCSCTLDRCRRCRPYASSRLLGFTIMSWGNNAPDMYIILFIIVNFIGIM